MQFNQYINQNSRRRVGLFHQKYTFTTWTWQDLLWKHNSLADDNEDPGDKGTGHVRTKHSIMNLMLLELEGEQKTNNDDNININFV